MNWSEIGHYDSEFHTHPGLGDEKYDPHQTIDRYHEEGYRILALAAHDYDIPDDYMTSIYPWTGLSEIYENIRHVRNPTEDYKTYEEIANEPYQDRDPVSMNNVPEYRRFVRAEIHGEDGTIYTQPFYLKRKLL